MGSVAKSREKGIPHIYGELRSQDMRRPLVIYDFAPNPSEFPFI